MPYRAVLGRTLLIAAAALGELLVGAASGALDPAKPPRPLEPGTKLLKVQSWSTNQVNRNYDGQWAGIRAASDGNVYFASSTHSNRCGAGLFKHDPRTGRTTVLCKDITTVCGEDPAKTTPQGKVHSDIVGLDGWIYFTTHLANEWPEAKENYPGSHLVGYELSTGKFRDFGVFRPRCTGYSGIVADPPRKRIYVYVVLWAPKRPDTEEGAHLYCVNVASGEKKEVGMVGPGFSAAFCLLADRAGDCWFSTAHTDSALFRAEGASGKVRQWPEALPPRIDALRDAPAARQDERWWFWGQRLAGGDTFVVGPRNAGRLYAFDPAQAPDWPKAFRPLEPFIGPFDLGIALAKDRIYYIQREGQQPGVKADDNHLMSVSLDPQRKPAIIDHGLIVDQDGRRPWRVQSLAADDAGRVYMVGDWFLNPGDKGTTRYNRKADSYDEQIRGQFFAAADVSRDVRTRTDD